MVFSLLRDAVKAFAYHYKEGNMNWPMVIYLVLTHMAAWIGVTSIPGCKWQTWAWAFILWPITGLGITAGVHRLWAHRSYNATLPYRFLLMLFNSIANQGPIYHWARDHRVHHKYSETDADPHNATRGFFFAHMGWLLVKKHPKYVPCRGGGVAGGCLSVCGLMECVAWGTNDALTGLTERSTGTD